MAKCDRLCYRVFIAKFMAYLDEPFNGDEEVVEFQDLEKKVLAEVRAEAGGDTMASLEKASVLRRISGIVRSIYDCYTEWTLPEGVDMERYRFIMKMYDELLARAIKGNLKMGKNWVRISPQLDKPKLGVISMMDAKYDVLDFVLDNYLDDEIIQDQIRFRMVRYYFVRELNLGGV